ncbi:uncharacterized protein LOC129951706 [Eupeodes corollae]|uniref:uncharacterized protein LOC129951706 n=1 Tax=Eupeodes corollae TaxID=290404 RepID=UPI00248FB295|nr:uncharacterized protein LOC129951706 [Eupeodes corollae]
MWTQDYLFVLFYVCTCYWFNVLCELDYLIILDRMESIKGDREDLVNFSEWKVSRKGSNYFISGNFTYEVDMDDSFSRGITTAYSPFANSHFIKQPFQLEKVPMCIFHNTTYKKYIEPTFKGHTNFPEIPAEGLCPIPKGTYFAKDAALDEKNLPIHMPRGLWRLEEKYFKDKNCIGGLRLFAHIKDKN